LVAALAAFEYPGITRLRCLQAPNSKPVCLRVALAILGSGICYQRLFCDPVRKVTPDRVWKGRYQLMLTVVRLLIRTTSEE
jgi:hypothetical protein